MLTLQQIHENNVVAKEYLKALIEINAEAKAEKARRKKEWSEASFGTKCLIVFCNVLKTDEKHSELLSNSMLQSVERNLRFYFKMHYKYGKIHSGRSTPKLEISWTSYGVINNTTYIRKLVQIPHEV